MEKAALGKGEEKDFKALYTLTYEEEVLSKVGILDRFKELCALLSHNKYVR